MSEINEIKKDDIAQEQMLEAEKLKKRKKNIIKAVVILCAAAAVMLIASAILQKINENKENEKKYSYDPLSGDYGEGFYPPEDDIMKDPEYAEKDRIIKYTYQGVGTEYSLDGEDDLTAQAKLFVDYFNAAIGGDGVTLNTLFTDEYFKNAGKEIKPYEDRFAMQKIYSITVSSVGYSYTENTIEGVLTHDRFKVSFLLKDNNGQFRPDLPEPDGGTIPVVFEVLTLKGVSKINHIYKYQYLKSE